MSWLLSCLLPCQKQRDDYRSGISEEKRPYEGLPQAVRQISICLRFPVALNLALNRVPNKARAIPHNSKCRYGERGAADAKPKAQIILDSYRAFWQRRCRAAATGAVLKAQGGNCAVLPKIKGQCIRMLPSFIQRNVHGRNTDILSTKTFFEYFLLRINDKNRLFFHGVHLSALLQS